MLVKKRKKWVTDYLQNFISLLCHVTNSQRSMQVLLCQAFTSYSNCELQAFNWKINTAPVGYGCAASVQAY